MIEVILVFAAVSLFVLAAVMAMGARRSLLDAMAVHARAERRQAETRTMIREFEERMGFSPDELEGRAA